MHHNDSRQKHTDQDEVFFLEPGYIYIGSEKAAVKTVLGNCASVCLWDLRLRYGGMNHFVFPTTGKKDKATPTFGNVATKVLIKKMINTGSKINDLVAQIVGGAKPEHKNDMNLGRKNTDIAREILVENNIKIKSEDIGGHLGRKVIFDVKNGHLMVIKVHEIRTSDWKNYSIGDQGKK